MGHIATEPKPVLPFLQSFYDVVVLLSWAVARFACGFHLLVHGWGKVMRGGAQSGSTLAFGLFLTFVEFGGGVYTRSACSRASSRPRWRSRWPI